MTQHCRRFSALILAAALAVSASAQVPETQDLPTAAYYKPIRFDRLGADEGLSQNVVFDIQQDKDGFLWFGVEGALNRYDGYEMKVYRAVPYDSTSVSQGSVWSLYEDRAGTLWVGSSRGLSRYNRDTDTFTRYTPSQRNPNNYFSGTVTDILEDRDGTLWVTTIGTGLRKMTPDGTTDFEGYVTDPEDPTTISGNTMMALHEDAAGYLWVGGFGALNRVDRATGNVTRFPVTPGPGDGPVPWIVEIREDPARPDALWLGTSDGLVSLNRNTGIATTLYSDLIGGQSVWVSGFAQDPEAPHVYWLSTGFPLIGTGNGLIRYDTRTGEATRHLNNPGDPLSLPDNNLFSIYTDRSGIVWAGVQRAGLARFDPSPDGFLHYRHMDRDPESLPAGGIWDFGDDHLGGLWATVDYADVRTAGRLVRIDRVTGKIARFRADPRDATTLRDSTVSEILIDAVDGVWILYGNNAGNGSWLTRIDPTTGRARSFQRDDRDVLTDVNQDPQGALWISQVNPESGAGVLRFDPAANAFTLFEHDPEDPGTLSSNQVSDVFTDASGDIWVATLDGLNHFDPASETFSRHYRSPGDSTENVNAAWQIAEGNDGDIWGVTLEDEYLALFRFDTETETWTTYTHDPADRTSFFQSRPVGFTTIHELASESGTVWIGSGEGLIRLDTASGQFRHISLHDGLVDDTIYGLLEDDSGRLWMSTNGGLVMIVPGPDDATGPLNIRSYDFSDGLQANEFNAGALFKSPRTGELFFGGINGITAFSPDQVVDNSVAPTVRLTDFKLFNESVQPGPDAPLKKRIAYADEIRLKHNQKSIEFDYVGLHYQNPKKNRYRYQLEGFDDDWVEAGSQRAVAYTNLDPGRYTFRVTAANSDGVWNDTPASVRVIVAPPWWRTVWAYLLYGILFVGAVFAGNRVQRRRLLRKEREQAAIAQAELRAEAAESEARALEADNQRKKNIEQLSEIGKELTASLDVDAIFEKLYQHVNELMDADSFGVGVYHAERNEIEYRLAIDRGKRYKPYVRDATDKNQFPVWCIENRKPIFINDVGAEYTQYIDEYDDKPAMLEDGSLSTVPQSLLYLPLIAQNRVLGVITVQSHEKNAYSRHELNVLQNLASYTSIALDNADAYRQIGSTLDQVKAMQAQLVQQEKMASLGQLTAGIAHEIKNPLNFINNFSELNQELAEELLEAVKNGESIEELVADMRRNANVIADHGKRADGIVDAMMRHAAGGSSERVATDINELVSDNIDFAYHGKRAQAKERQDKFDVEIEKDFSDDVGRADVVPQDIGRVLLNLLGNAFDAVQEKASAANGEFAPRVSVSTRRHNGQIEIRVADNGPGIPEEIRNKIFEQFFTTKPTGSGTGLGLSLSYDIVSQGHGGTLFVESEPGHGASFVVRLPVTSMH